jgi:hypothetical protein
MILIAAVTIDGGRDGYGGGGGGRGRGGDDGNDGNSRNGTNWEVEQIKGTDGKGKCLTMVELGMEVTVEGI